MSMKDIVKAALAEQPSTVKELVQNELYSRAMAAVDEMRAQIAPNMFNESEQLDELSKGTLGNYVKKASNKLSYHTVDYVDNFRKNSNNKKEIEKGNKDFHSAMKRKKGIDRAVDRLSGQNVDNELKQAKDKLANARKSNNTTDIEKYEKVIHNLEARKRNQ